MFDPARKSMLKLAGPFRLEGPAQCIATDVCMRIRHTITELRGSKASSTCQDIDLEASCDNEDTRTVSGFTRHISPSPTVCGLLEY